MSKRKHAGRGRLTQDMKPIVVLESLSQPSTSRSFMTQPSNNGRNNFLSNSQPSTSRSSPDQQLRTTSKRTYGSRSQRQAFNESRDEMDTNDDGYQLAGTVVRYFLTLDRGKKPITKTSIVKNCLAGHGKEFRCAMSRAKTYLSQIFGYNLVELEGNKYILVNEIKNNSAYIQLSEKETPRQDFVSQKYLDKIITEKGDPPKFELKWGPRAEYEFSRRAALEFVSQVYNGRPLNSWPAQCKTMIAKEQSNKA